MIDISRAYFRFDMPAPPEPELLEYAQSIFDDLDRLAARLMPLPDYTVYVAVEEGSVKGGGKILAAAGVLYFGIGQFGSFVQGVRELRQIGEAVGEFFIEESAGKPLVRHEPLQWRRKDAGKVQKIDQLFKRVAAGEINPETGTRLTIALLDADDSLPPEAYAKIQEAFTSIQKDPEQLLLDLPGTQAPTDHNPPPAPRPVPHVPTRRLRIEIERESKYRDPKIKRTYRKD